MKKEIIKTEGISYYQKPYIAKKDSYLVIADLHIRYHNKQALNLALERLPDNEGLILLGDIVDFGAFMRWTKRPEKLDIFTEIKIVNEILNDIRSTFKGEIIYKYGNHECFDIETKVLTENGFKKITDLSKNEKVATLNIDKNIIEYQKPNKIILKEYEGQMYSIKNEYIDLFITPNHRILYKYPTSKDKTRLDEIGKIDITEGRVILRCAGTEKNKEYNISDDEIRITAWLITDGRVSQLNKYQPNGKYRLCSFYQRKSKVHLITDILDRLEWGYSYKERQRDIKQVCGKKLKKKPEISCEIHLLQPSNDKMRELCNDKKYIIPEWVYKLSDRQFDIFLESVIDGDGSRHKAKQDTSFMVYGIKPLLNQLQHLCFIHNYRTTISEYRNNTWRLNITKNDSVALDRFVRHTSKTNYKGVIWCVNTDNDTIVVRRNNKISITGNSRFQTFIFNNAPFLWEVESAFIEEKLNFNKFNITKVDVNQPIRFSELNIIHGHEIRATTMLINVARTYFLKANANILLGHWHVSQDYIVRDIQGKVKGAWAIGCLCDLYPEYNPLNQHVHGFAEIQKDKTGFEVFNRKIINGKVR